MFQEVHINNEHVAFSNSKCSVLDTLGYRSREPVTIICTCEKFYCLFTYVVYIVVAFMLEEVLKFHIFMFTFSKSNILTINFIHLYFFIAVQVVQQLSSPSEHFLVVSVEL